MVGSRELATEFLAHSDAAANRGFTETARLSHIVLPVISPEE
jgi:hypothetical protein